MALEIAALVALLLAAIPAALTAINLRLYRPAAERRAADGRPPAVSLLIPARDEERSIGSAIAAALAGQQRELEVLVMDDHSEDRTAAIVTTWERRDPRVRLLTAPPLPPGWNGKQHACAELARAARHDVLLFVDADVRLAPGAVARIAAEVGPGRADLASGIPRQITGSVLEKLLIPLIHFILLGYLPIAGMRRSRGTAYAAGCGQLLAVRRTAYEAAGGHAAIRGSRHDGLTLPRAVRRAGGRTDLFDATSAATCRMYRGAGAVWNGLAKNATEGMAAPAAILPWSLLLLGGQVAPPALLAAAPILGATPAAVGLAAAGAVCVWAPRLMQARRFRHSPLGVLLHPLAVALLVAVQWYALLRETAGRPVAWKGRGAGHLTATEIRVGSSRWTNRAADHDGGPKRPRASLEKP